MRALRRHHRQRMRRKAERIIRSNSIYDPKNMFLRIRKTADNLQICSCYGCGNPRRWERGWNRLTIQEKKLCAMTDLVGE